MLSFKDFYYILDEDVATDQQITQIQTALAQVDNQINQRTQPLLQQKQQLQRRLGPLLKKKQDDDARAGKQQQPQQQMNAPQGQQPVTGTTTPGGIGAGTPGAAATTTPIRQ